MSASFVHLRLHTEYSLVDSVVRVPDLVQAVVLARHAGGGRHGPEQPSLVKFYREALKQGVQPIVGVDLLVREAGERRSFAHRFAVPVAGGLSKHHPARRAYVEGHAVARP